MKNNPRANLSHQQTHSYTPNNEGKVFVSYPLKTTWTVFFTEPGKELKLKIRPINVNQTIKTGF